MIKKTPTFIARTTIERKELLAKMAYELCITESALLNRLVDDYLLQTNAIETITENKEEAIPSKENKERLSIRLRPGDRKLLELRAARRKIKTATYTAILIHNHVTSDPITPINELNEIKNAVARLAAIERKIGRFMAETEQCDKGNDLITEILTKLNIEIDITKNTMSDFVRTNLKSWESEV